MQRERKSAEGMMLQTDASPHDWLEGRAPEMELPGAIDDATGKVVYARFRPSEDQLGYLKHLPNFTSCFALLITDCLNISVRSDFEVVLDAEFLNDVGFSQLASRSYRMYGETYANRVVFFRIVCAYPARLLLRSLFQQR